MKLGKLLNHAVELAQPHESQVIRSIRHHLSHEGANPLTFTEDGEEALDARLRIRTQQRPTQIVRLGSSEESISYQAKSGFKVVLKGLPHIALSDCNDFEIDLTGVDVDLAPQRRPKFQLQLANCKNFVIRGGHIKSATNVCLIHSCEQFRITQLRAKATDGYGVIISDSRYFSVDRCSFHGGLASGIYCLGNTAYGRIEYNQCNGGRGFYNCDAGLHINHCTEDLAPQTIPERSHEARSILEKRKKPAFLFVRNNIFCNNRAQGIYCEGCTLSVFENNIIVENNKEGICLDWGSALNVVSSNSVARNGERARLSEAEVRADFIEHFPLLADGSCSLKLPGLSIDNGALNLILANQIAWNFGGGIKMVRTGIANVVVRNVIHQNGIGANERFSQFHGIFLLGLGAGPTEFNSANQHLDLLPSVLNIIAGNTITGDSQHHSVYADRQSSGNLYMLDNWSSCNGTSRPVCNLKAISDKELA